MKWDFEHGPAWQVLILIVVLTVFWWMVGTALSTLGIHF